MPAAILIQMANEAMRRKRERNKAIRRAFRLVFFALLTGLLLDLLFLLFVIIYIVFVPSQWATEIVSALNFLDYRMMVSLAVVEVPIGAFLAIFAWRVLGDRKQNIIDEAEAMMKYDHLRIVKRKKKQYIVNLHTKQAYLMPLFIKKLASEGIILGPTAKETENVSWTETEPKPYQLGLGSPPSPLGGLRTSEVTSDHAQNHL